MVNPILLNGRAIHADPCIPEFKESHRQERKWAHRVMWRRYQRFTVKQERVVIIMGDMIVTHPNTLELMKKIIGSATINDQRGPQQ